MANTWTLNTTGVSHAATTVIKIIENIRTWFFGSAGCGRIFASLIPSNHRWEV
jgi:hypothetical protein